MIYVILVVLLMLLMVGYELYSHYKPDYAFKYRNVKVSYHSVFPGRAVLENAIKAGLQRDVDRGYLTEERAKELLQDRFKTYSNRSLDAAIKRGIDAAHARLPYFNFDGLEIKVERYPITVVSGNGMDTANGTSYCAQRRLVISDMPDEKGGSSATASLVVHEAAHVYLWESKRDYDYNHDDKAFWGKIDAAV